MIRLLLTLALSLTAPAAATAQAGGPSHVGFALVARTAGVAPGSTVWLGLRQSITPGWHTYWKNPGDAGQPTQLTWSAPKGWSAGDIVWPTPHRQRDASLVTYGYEGQAWLLVPLSAPKTARPGDTATIKAHVDVLVCKDLCIPESADLELDLPIVSSAPSPDPRWAGVIDAALKAAPKPLEGPVDAHASLSSAGVKLAVAGAALTGRDLAGAWFFPAQPGVIEYAGPETLERGPRGFTFTLKPTRALQTKGLQAPLEGVIALASGPAFEVSAAPGALAPEAGGLGPAPAADVVAAAAAERARPHSQVAGLALAILFGLIGGVILNLMPCVFPVLSIKAAALSRNLHDPREARRDGLWFLAGVMAAFISLAAALIAAKAAGQAVGWGFQLQSPAVTAFLSLLTLAVGLNLSGVFQAGLSLQGLGSSLQTRAGASGAFFTGVLAVVVGAPCSAPIMASAVGYAVAAGPLEIICVFLALGLGLAAPFVALSFSPGLLRRLPRPGPWMEGFRRVLAFPMYATAAFIGWVFARQSGDDALGWLLASAVALALSLHLWGRVQAANVPGRAAVAGLGAAGLAFAIAVFACVWGVIGAAQAPAAAQASAGATSIDGLATEPWTQARLAQARSEGRPVFVNFTAAWCVTCKVNERLAFSDASVRQAFASTHTLYLVGDWTRRNDDITRALAQQGRAGVPLYLIYRPGAAEPQVLPQLLTPGAIVHALGGA